MYVYFRILLQISFGNFTFFFAGHDRKCGELCSKTFEEKTKRFIFSFISTLKKWFELQQKLLNVITNIDLSV
jgi:hypothetical protein